MGIFELWDVRIKSDQGAMEWDVRIKSDQGAMDMDLFRSTFIQKVRLINPKIEGVTKVSSHNFWGFFSAKRRKTTKKCD